jgi:hypothetical protein
MSIGNGVIQQARLRPVRSSLTGSPNTGNGVGINYGMGRGSVRVAGVTYSFWDSSGQYAMTNQVFVARVAIVNGDYPFSALAFTPTTDLGNVDVLYDQLVSEAGPVMLPTWMAGLVTDDALNCTALLSQIVWPAASGPPANIVPQSFFVLHGDHYASREDALSPGSIFEGRPDS